MNLYGFAAGDPVNFSDPFGLCSREDNWTNCPESVKDATAVRQGDNIVKAGAIAGLITGAGELLAAARGLLAAAESGPALARALGAAGETASGLVKNSTRIPSLTGTAAYRIPDGLTATTLSEVKNVSSLSLTNQLRDFSAFAQQSGRSFDLFVRKTTQLSGPLQQFIRDNNIVLKFLK